MTFNKTLYAAATLSIALMLLSPSAFAQKKKAAKQVEEPVKEFKLPSDETDEQKAERMQWWSDARFGMFIHWGLYSMPARHEWIKKYERIPEDHYDLYFKYFNPDKFNPQIWAAKAKEAGMKYVVLTSKHHEGFCLWDTQYTDYKATNTPVGRDLLKEFVEAFRAEGIRVGFYYSLLDWHHPDYTIDSNHPLFPKDKDKAVLDSLNAGKNMDNYRQYMKNQITELLTKYGDIDIIWYDFSWEGPYSKGAKDWDAEGILKLTRSLRPDIIIDDRLGMKDTWGAWDVMTPEQKKVKQCVEWNGKKVHWETCQTFSGSWGYHRDETSWKSKEQLIEMLVETVSKGGNLLLNVGPNSRGEFDERASQRLQEIGEWMRVNDRAVYGCTYAPEGFEAPDNCLLTYNPKTKRLYITMLDYPLFKLDITFGDKIEYAQFLHDGSELKFDDETIWVPVAKPGVTLPVIECMLK